MKRALLILLLATACFGQGLTLRSPLRDISPVASAYTFLVDENFEGTGAPTDFSQATATVDFDYAASPLQGAQSCQVNAAAVMRLNITSTASVFLYCLISRKDPTVFGDYVIALRDAGDNDVGGLYWSQGSSGCFGYNGSQHGGNQGDLFPEDTTQSCWLEWIKGTGSDGEMRIYVAATPTKPGSPTSVTTVGTATANCTYILFRNFGGGEVIYDSVKLSATAIGSNP